MNNDNFSLNDELIKISGLVYNERVLIVDNNSGLLEEIESRKLDVHMTCCDPGDFTTLTKYSEDHMNAFDVIFCPNALYDLRVKNRQFVLQFLVWAMKNRSRLVFSIPNIKNFIINKKMQWMDKDYLLREEDRYFRLVESSKWSQPQTWFMPKSKFWHKTTVRFPLQMIRTWNSENPFSQWDTDNIAVKQTGEFIICSVDMKKSINSPQTSRNINE